MKSIVNIHTETPLRRSHAANKNRALGTTASVTFDLDGAKEVINRLSHLNLRLISPNELNAAIADLTRAGVRAESRYAMTGRTLLNQLLAETERRAARPVSESRAPVPQGSYTALVLRAEHDHAPKKYDRYV